MSHKAKVNGVVYNITSGLTKQNGQILSIRYGKTKENGVVKTISFSTAISELVLTIPESNPGNTDHNYLIANYVGGASKKYMVQGEYTLSDVESLYFYCYGKTAEIIVDGVTVVQGKEGYVEYTWIPTASAVTVSFEETAYNNARKITVTTQ